MTTNAAFQKVAVLERTRRRVQHALGVIETLSDGVEDAEVTLAETLAELIAALAATEPKAIQLVRGTIRRKRDNQVMSFQLEDDQKVDYSIGETDDANNPTPFQGTAVWSVSDDTILNIDSVSDDGSSATISAVGALGTAQVAVTVTLPDGTPAGSSDDVTVVVSAPTSITLTAGTAVHK